MVRFLALVISSTSVTLLMRLALVAFLSRLSTLMPLVLLEFVLLEFVLLKFVLLDFVLLDFVLLDFVLLDFGLLEFVLLAVVRLDFGTPLFEVFFLAVEFDAEELLEML